MKNNSTYTFKSEQEREVAVCIAVQKIGLATIQDIITWIENKGGKISEKQVSKCAENLRRRDMLSIDLSQKNEKGISEKRYVMRKIKLGNLEIAQIKDIVDSPEVKPLIEELDRSKGVHKKGIKTFDYYIAEVLFKTNKGVQGFIPDSEGIVRHYRNEKGDIIFYGYHFKNWFRANLPLINRASSAIGDIKFGDGEVKLNGNLIMVEPISDPVFPIIEKFITNVETGFHSANGTGGRGSRKIECLPENSLIKTWFAIPRDLIKPDKFELALKIITQRGSAFGGGSKLSTGKLFVDSFSITEDELFPED